MGGQDNDRVETARKPAGRGRARKRGAFLRGERGSIMFLAMSFLIVMVMVGGIGIDVANYVRTRSILQNNLDTATLAAANLSQEIEAQRLVDSWLTAGEMDHLNVDVRPEITFADPLTMTNVISKVVTAEVDARIPTIFMQWWGIDALPAHLASTAAHRLSNLEISLVLDVSGSMSRVDAEGLTRLARLQAAATRFVNFIVAASEPGTVTISVVPYSTQVTAGNALLQHFTTDDRHDYNTCLQFDDAHYATPALDPAVEVQRADHFDRGLRYDQWQGWIYDRDTRRRAEWNCRTAATSEIVAWSAAPTDLATRIAALTAGGNTSIDIGLKWGMALLDPSTRPVAGAMASALQAAPAAQGRPLDYGHAVKVLILMTDGQNTTEYRLDPSVREGPSGIRRAFRGAQRFYSVFDPESDGGNDGDGTAGESWYWPYRPTVTDQTQWFYSWTSGWYPVTTQVNSIDWSHRWRNESIGASEDLTETELTWPEVWNDMTLSWYADELKSDQGWRYGFSNTRSDIETGIGPVTKDARVETLCTAGKAAGMIVYTISADAPSSAADLLRRCASSPTHAYDVDTVDIDETFAEIASSITMLKLTQ